MKSVVKTDGKIISFTYDPMGNRIGKKVTQGGVLQSYTAYALDAQGNPMATYELKMESGTKVMYLSERMIYGSSRIGAENGPSAQLPNGTPLAASTRYSLSVGDKRYELANHLGNVLNVISDRKIPLRLNQTSTTVIAFNPNVIQYSDYFPFGMTMPGKNGGSEYRFGFQGQKKDDEVSGAGNSYTAEYWQYDSRLGRRWNPDPVLKRHESPYVTFANNPIWFIDPSGADTLNFNANGDITKFVKGGKDVFNLVDGENKVLKSKQFESGTLQYKWQYDSKDPDTKEPLKIDVLQIKGNNNAKALFEFFSENSNVEWGFYATKRGTSENGFISTSHQKKREAGSVVLYAEKLWKEPYDILSHSHSHPSNADYPSGSWTIPAKDFDAAKIKGTWGDTGFAGDIKSNQTKRQTTPILFKIYLPGAKKYINYDEKSSLRDYQK